MLITRQHDLLCSGRYRWRVESALYQGTTSVVPPEMPAVRWHEPLMRAPAANILEQVGREPRLWYTCNALNATVLCGCVNSRL